jgi:hypothetical protein
MTAFPSPLIEEHSGILVVRDDRIPGGTKRRVLDRLLIGADEFVYASAAYGYAQVALAYACRDLGKRATIFTAQRQVWHPRTLEAQQAGAQIIGVPYGYLSNVTAKAKRYAQEHGAALLPFGFDTGSFRNGLADVARSLPLKPREVWSVAGSGTLCRALQQAWPHASVNAVLIGAEAETSTAERYRAPERFEQDARYPPPFASCGNYDAKAWQFIQRHASPGALFWNVAG